MEVDDFSFKEDDSLVLVVSSDLNNQLVLNTSDWSTERTLNAPGAEFCEWRKGSNDVAISGDDLEIYDASDGTNIATNDSVEGIAFVNNDDYLCAFDADNFIVYTPDTYAKFYQSSHSLNNPNNLGGMYQGDLAAVSDDDTTEVYEIEDDADTIDGEVKLIDTFDTFMSFNSSVDWTRDDKNILIGGVEDVDGSDDGRVKIYDADNRDLVQVASEPWVDWFTDATPFENGFVGTGPGDETEDDTDFTAYYEATKITQTANEILGEYNVEKSSPTVITGVSAQPINSDYVFETSSASKSVFASSDEISYNASFSQATGAAFFAAPDEVVIRVGDNEITSYRNLKIEQRLNEVDTFEFEAFITDESQRGFIADGNDVKIFENGDLKFKGRMEEVNYDTTFKVNVEGEGMETKLLDRKTNREQFNDNAHNIATSILPETVETGEIEAAPRTEVFFDHDNLARSIASTANAVGYDWRISQVPQDDFESDRLDFVERIGEDLERTLDDTRVISDFETGGTEGWERVSNDGDVSVTDENVINGDFSLSIDYLHEEGVDTLSTKAERTFEQDELLNDNGVQTLRWRNTATEELDQDYDPFLVTDIYLERENGETVQDIGIEYFSPTLNFASTDGGITSETEGSLSVNPYESGSIINHTLEIDFDNNTATLTAVSTDTDGTVLLEDSDTIELSRDDFVGIRKMDTRFSNDADDPTPVSLIKDDVELEGEFTEPINWSIGEELRFVDNDTDDGFLANKITLLGRGDGVNQLEAEVWAAANEFTQLTQVLSEDLQVGETFTVDNTEILGDTGDNITVKIGVELIDAEITSDTELEVQSRGVDNTEIIEHRENISVWLHENKTQGLGPFEPNSDDAQQGSSIQQNGVKELRETDRTIDSLPTLEQVADRELRNRYTEVKRISVAASQPRIKGIVELGDTFNIVDSGAALNDTFRVIGIDSNRRSVEEETILHLANRPRRLVERLSEIERDRDTLNAHAQGATNINSQNLEDNADEDNPLDGKIYIPEDAVAINKIDLNLARKPFRGYVRNEPHKHDIELEDHNHEVNIDTTTEATDAGEHTVKLQQIVPDNTDVNITLSSQLGNFSVVAPDARDDWEGYLIDLTIANFGDSSDTYGWRIENSDGDVIVDDSVFLDSTTTSTRTYNVGLPEVFEGETLQLIWTDGSFDHGSTSDATDKKSYTQFDIQPLTSHSHGIEDTETSDGGGGVETTTEGGGEPVYGLFEPSEEEDVDLDVFVDGNLVETIEDVGVGFETLQPIRIEQELGDPLTGAWHDVEVVPREKNGGEDNGRSRLQAFITEKVFVESRVD